MTDWTGILLLLAFFVGAPVTIVIVYYYAFKSAKKRDKEKIEAIIKETEDSFEKVLGRIRVWKSPKFSLLGEMPLIHAVLVFTANNVFVKIIDVERLHEASGGSIIGDVYRYAKGRGKKSEVGKDFAIANSNVKRVWLKKFGRGVKLKVVTSEKEYEWNGNG
ncbi:MAG: hypothetical protein JSV51_03000, partial [Candidatus Bathyarchaeota archaeon]